MKLKIKKGDSVQVISGNDKGKSGKVLMIDPTKMRVIIEGVNVRKRHTRPNQAQPQGGIIEREMSIHYSNVMAVGKDGKTTRNPVAERTTARKDSKASKNS